MFAHQTSAIDSFNSKEVAKTYGYTSLKADHTETHKKETLGKCLALPKLSMHMDKPNIANGPASPLFYYSSQRHLTS